MNEKIQNILTEIESVIVGKNENVEKILMAILAQGHVLMEDVPGVGKTTTALTFAKVPYADAIAEVFGPDKADVTYECAGNNATTDMAIQNSRKGSVIVLVAVFADWAKVDLARLNDSELTLDTSMMYRHEDYVDALRFVAEGKIQLKPLISKHFAFRDFLSAYQYIDANRERTMKVVVDIQD